VLDRQGTDANALNNGMAATGDEVVGALARTQAATFLDTSEKGELDRLVFDRFGILRKQAAPARGSFTLNTVDPAPANFSVPVGTLFSTPDGVQFVSEAPASFLAGSTGPVYVTVRSVLAGLNQQVPAGTEVSITSSIVGAPTDLFAACPLATAGADDIESDDSLRDRARDFFTNARRGTLASLIVGALSAPGVRTAAAFETVDSLGRPVGSAQVIVGDAYTDALVVQGSNPAQYQTQSQVLALTVASVLDDYRAAGIYVAVRVGQTILQGFQLGLTFTPSVSLDPDLVALQARSLIVQYVNNSVAGALITRATLQALLDTVPGLVSGQNTIISPSADIQAGPLQLIRTNLGICVANAISPVFALQGSSNPDAP
jgi:uncharacterized phage protein gp47/JayE